MIYYQINLYHSNSLLINCFKYYVKLLISSIQFDCQIKLSHLNNLIKFENIFLKFTGVLIGRYFDHNGDETAYAKELNNKIKQCEIMKERSKEEHQKYPPCNSAWSADEGTKVWCTKSR